MNHLLLQKSVLLAAAIAGVLISNCGRNPFGPGEAGYKVFANLGKAIAKPSQINDEQAGKENSKTTLASARGMAKRLAKTAAGAADPGPAWLTGHAIADSGNGVYTYWETVRNKPSEEDPDKLVTGRGEIKFRYDGVPTISAFDASKILAIISFEMIGREHKTWNSVIDSVRLRIEFLDPSMLDFKPGKSMAWGKNISGLQVQGRGDTASFTLDSLDDVNHIQYGEGHFYDAHSGRQNDGEAQSFDFTIQVIHKNDSVPAKPYLRYQDNEGVISFALERAGKDSLFFSIRFYDVHKRDGTIRKNGVTGPVVATFTYDDKSMTGEAIYYDDDGKAVENEDL